MYCIQCEQAKSGGCRVVVGNCGKLESTAALQDVLIHVVKGISMYAHRARALGAADSEVDAFILGGYFATLTNVNFDDAFFVSEIRKAVTMRERARFLYEHACRDADKFPETLHGPAVFDPGKDKEAMLEAAHEAALDRHMDRDGPTVVGLRALLLYAIKGCAAYADHAHILGRDHDSIYAGLHQAGDFLAADPTDVEALVDEAMKLGALNLEIMAVLDEAHTARFGHPEISKVRVTPLKGKCILASGHDLVRLEALLKQTAGKGIDVYTHGELLPANAYPALKAYPHLKGNYGGPWQEQQREFQAFPGAIVMTSNCLINPELRGYKDRVFTTGPVGWPGVTHLEDFDYGPAIACALKQPGFAKDEPEKFITTGFARNTVMSVAGTVLDMIARKDINHIFLIGGCDGTKPGRSYFHDLAMATPKDSLVLTLGCGKYRFNKEEFGAIGAIPRLLDMGQCNDAYSAIQVAVALAKALNCGVNDLPLTLALSWFEQKATAILLTLFYLGVKNIYLGPTLPACLTPEAIAVIQERFALKPTGTVAQDLKDMLAA